jgi:hypothetical protein
MKNMKSGNEKIYALAILFFCFLMFLSSCSTKHSVPSFYDVVEKGVIQERGFTTFMYGTHLLVVKGEFFALRSSNVNLDDYLNKRVTIKGHFIEGYPVDGGPQYIEAEEIE